MENIKKNNLKYDSNGLIPTVVQERKTKEILMVAYSNKESLEMTIKNKYGYFWSRSKNKLWKKGETSGNLLKLFNIYTDCDNDTLIFEVELQGSAACHTGSRSCFFKKIENASLDDVDSLKEESILLQEELKKRYDEPDTGETDSQEA